MFGNKVLNRHYYNIKKTKGQQKVFSCRNKIKNQYVLCKNT